MKKHVTAWIALGICTVALNQKAQGQSAYEIGGQVFSTPPFANYISLTQPWPVLPFLPYDGVPVYAVLNLTNYYAYDDSGIDLDLLASSQTTMEDDSSGDGGDGPLWPLYGTNDFYLSIALNTNFSLATVTAHGTIPGHKYELYSSTNLFAPFASWVPTELKTGDPSTNKTDFTHFPPTNPPVNFFRAETANDIVHLFSSQNAIQTNPIIMNPLQPGSFEFDHTASSSLTVYFRISGTASNGVDFTGEDGNPLPDFVHFPDDVSSTNLEILPVPGRTYPKPLTIILTMIPTNTYLISPDAVTATITISEPLFGPVACIHDPDGIAFHSPSNSLIVSSLTDGSLNRIYATTVVSNGITVTNVIVTNWTTISGLQSEVELAIPRRTAFGFTNGDLYFGNNIDPSRIGWVSANGNASNMDWCIITDEHVALQGGVTFDETRTYSNNLIAVSGQPPSFEDGSVWMIGSNRQARLLATIAGAETEGVITITNDVTRWGPWAGKILVGDERGIIWAVDTNGTVTRFDLGIDAESLNLIPTNENLYVCAPDLPCPDFFSPPGAVLKLQASFFAGHEGDLLITQGGEASGVAAALFIVHWNASTSSFNITTIQDLNISHFEHVTFAPLDLPVMIPDP